MGRLVKTVLVGQNRACRPQAAPAAPPTPWEMHRWTESSPAYASRASYSKTTESFWSTAGTAAEQPVGEDGKVLSEVRMVALDDLPAFGLSEKFVRLVRDGFLGKGSYGGEFHALYR